MLPEDYLIDLCDSGAIKKAEPATDLGVRNGNQTFALNKKQRKNKNKNKEKGPPQKQTILYQPSERVAPAIWSGHRYGGLLRLLRFVLCCADDCVTSQPSSKRSRCQLPSERFKETGLHCYPLRWRERGVGGREIEGGGRREREGVGGRERGGGRRERERGREREGEGEGQEREGWGGEGRERKRERGGGGEGERERGVVGRERGGERERGREGQEREGGGGGKGRERKGGRGRESERGGGGS